LEYEKEKYQYLTNCSKQSIHNLRKLKALQIKSANKDTITNISLVIFNNVAKICLMSNFSSLKKKYKNTLFIYKLS